MNSNAMWQGRGDAPLGQASELGALCFLATIVIVVVCFDSITFADGDTNWHIATGRWILAHRAVPTVDPFSFTVPGRRWVAHEWLSEVVLAAVQAAGGWSAVQLLVGACAGAAMALMARTLRRMLGVLSVIACVGLAFAILRVHLLARPHMLALPLLVLWTAQMVEARRAGRPPPLWLAPLMTLWANLHGSYVFGLVFTVPFAIEAWRLAGPARPRALLGWGLFLGLAGLAALINPNGVDDVLLPLQVMRLGVLQDIGEWKPTDLAHISPLVMALFLALFVCLYRGVRFGWERLSLLLLLLFMTFQHGRQEIILAAAGPLLLAQPLGAVLEPARAAPASGRASAWTFRSWAALGAAAALVVAIGAWRLGHPVRRVDSGTTPVAALAHVPPALRGAPVFNSYSFGGWLILNGVRPFVDGRADMYGDTFVRLALDTEAADPPAQALATLRRYGVVWSITTPGSGLIPLLDRTPGWRRLYEDRWAVVQVYQPALDARSGARAARPSMSGESGSGFAARTCAKCLKWSPSGSDESI
ncbi:hypothetical protein ACO2Q3_25630 [Caulobacter sp. KR2-114]|uniref:hypothetical protein n=1 Tax=Caulobacter sp. KR2-114 TaxID=3400912 RepID=UPI003C0EAD34